jgi:hypothetical protein
MDYLIETPFQLDHSLFDELLDKAEHAPSHTINVLKTRFQNDPSQLEWVFNTRTDEFHGDYEISSLWNIPTVMPKLALAATQIMTFETGINFDPTDFYIVRTKGHIPIHKDVQPTRAKFNFGVRNTDSAITTMYDDQHQVLNSVRMEDGKGYLINPHVFHSVDPVDGFTGYRYIATFKVVEKTYSLVHDMVDMLKRDMRDFHQIV